MARGPAPQEGAPRSHVAKARITEELALDVKQTRYPGEDESTYVREALRNEVARRRGATA